MFAVGPLPLSPNGTLMAAALACGEGAVVSHHSAAFLWGLADSLGAVEITVPRDRHPERQGIRIHRSVRPPTSSPADFRTRHGIPVTSPTRTLLDVALLVSERRLERLVNEADKLELIGADRLRSELEGRSGEPGVRALRRLLDRDSFQLTDSELEREFLRLVKGAGLPLPLTGRRVNGFVVDFFWPEHGVVVETDGLRYHRTAASQARDLERDQAHQRAGLLPPRFAHSQVRHSPDAVVATLSAALERRGYSASPP